MADNTTASNPIPATTMAMVRMAVLTVGSFAIGKGWVNTDQVNGIATYGLTVGTALYGLYKTFSRQKTIKSAEVILGGAIPKL